MTGFLMTVKAFGPRTAGRIQDLSMCRPCRRAVRLGQQVVVAMQAAAIRNLLQNAFAQLFDFVLAAQIVLIDVLAALIALGKEMSKVLFPGRQMAIDAIDSETVFVRAVC